MRGAAVRRRGPLLPDPISHTSERKSKPSGIASLPRIGESGWLANLHGGLYPTREVKMLEAAMEEDVNA